MLDKLLTGEISFDQAQKRVAIVGALYEKALGLMGGLDSQSIWQWFRKSIENDLTTSQKFLSTNPELGILLAALRASLRKHFYKMQGVSSQ